MESVYIVIHPQSVTGLYSALYPNQYSELQRIIKEENPLLIKDNVPTLKGIPKDKRIILCGAFRDFCVAIELDILQEGGYKVEIYEPGTIPSPKKIKK